jgi:predicted GNAT family acetyltransferase
MSDSVIDNEARRRFELPVGTATAIATYELDGDRVVLLHTEVPPELSGQGIGSRLARGVFERIRGSGRKAHPKCPFMAEWANRHAEYADVVVR